MIDFGKVVLHLVVYSFYTAGGILCLLFWLALIVAAHDLCKFISKKTKQE